MEELKRKEEKDMHACGFKALFLSPSLLPSLSSSFPSFLPPSLSSELFTNCLDMLSALLQALSPDFHMCVVSGGEEGKKSYIQCIKKMKVLSLE